jgi:hypothetical protein
LKSSIVRRILSAGLSKSFDADGGMLRDASVAIGAPADDSEMDAAGCSCSNATDGAGLLFNRWSWTIVQGWFGLRGQPESDSDESTDASHAVNIC